MRKRKRNLRGEEGQALVELALAIPLLLFVLFAIIDFGLAINQYNDATNLANLGARATAVMSGSNTIPATCTYQTSTYTTLVGYIACEGAQDSGALSKGVAEVTVCAPSTTAFNTGDSISVRVHSTFNWLSILTGGIGRIGGVVGPTSNIDSTATMRMEGTSSTPSSSTWLSGSSTLLPGSTTAVPAATLTTGSC